MPDRLRHRLDTWPAIALVVAEVVGVGIFLAPAAMARTLGSTPWVLGAWTAIALLSIAGALCFAELGSRFPEAGGPYVFLREAFGPRCAFVYGWMMLLVVDPGIAATLGVALARALLAPFRATESLVPAIAVAAIVVLAGLTTLGIDHSARAVRWLTWLKLIAVVALVTAVMLQRETPAAPPVASPIATPSTTALYSAALVAFFAFAGWWDLGKVSEEIVDPRRTLPRALVGGIVLVTAVYAAVSLASLEVMHGRVPRDDARFVTVLGATLFGDVWGASFVAGTVVVAAGGSLAAVLLGAPRVYLAMARGGVLPHALMRFTRHQAAPRATLLQAALACVLVTLGDVDRIVEYFVPATIAFLGLSAAAILVLPRPPRDAHVFRAPLHPLPIALFLALVVAAVALFANGHRAPTLIGFGVVALGVPVSWIVIRAPRHVAARASGG